jgi:hypothetical protein
MALRQTTLQRSRPAQSLVEFALTMPFLVAIVFGIIELGILFSVYVGLTNSAREATRAAAIYRYPEDTPLSTDYVAVNTIDGGRLVAFTTALSETMNPIVASDSVTVTLAYLPAPGAVYQQPAGVTEPFALANPLRAGDTISATLQHSHQLFWGIFGPANVLIQASSAARIEPGGAE